MQFLLQIITMIYGMMIHMHMYLKFPLSNKDQSAVLSGEQSRLLIIQLNA